MKWWKIILVGIIAGQFVFWYGQLLKVSKQNDYQQHNQN